MQIINKNILIFINSVLMVFHLEMLLNFERYIFFVSTEMSKGILISILGLLVINTFYKRRLLYGIIFLLSLMIKYEVMYGADTFVTNILLILSLIDLKTFKKDFLSIMGYLILFSKITIIYVCNGLAKFADPVWQSGKILNLLVVEDIFPIQVTGLNFLTKLPESIFMFIDLASTYSVLLLQFLIILVFFSKFRSKIALLFIVKHLFIALTMHPMFGLVCICVHGLVLTYNGNIITDVKKATV